MYGYSKYSNTGTHVIGKKVIHKTEKLQNEVLMECQSQKAIFGGKLIVALNSSKYLFMGKKGKHAFIKEHDMLSCLAPVNVFSLKASMYRCIHNIRGFYKPPTLK